jgi:hypothetical protein
MNQQALWKDVVNLWKVVLVCKIYENTGEALK